MGESLKEIIARVKAQNLAKKSGEEEKPRPKAVESEDEFDEDEEEEKPKKSKESESKEERPKGQEANQGTVVQQIEALQNNGVFRIELLGQLNEIKTSLNTLIEVLSELIYGKD